MALYSLIQFTGVTLLYAMRSSFGAYQYVYVDVVLVFPLVALLSYTQSSRTLVSSKPPSSLMSFPVLFSVFSQIGVQAVFQVGAFLLLRTQYPLYQPCLEYVHHATKYSDYFYCQENTTIFTFANLQYLVVAVALTVGSPFKQPIYSNRLLLLLLFCQTLLNVVIFFWPPLWLFRLFNVPFPPILLARPSPLLLQTPTLLPPPRQYLLHPLLRDAHRQSSRPSLRKTPFQEMTPLFYLILVK